MGRSGVDELSLPKANRLLRSSEFRQTYESGVRMTSRYFTAFWLRDPRFENTQKCGLTVPRTTGSAVTRNRLKRRMREAIRRHLGDLPENSSIVFNPRRSAIDAPFEELCQEVGRILSRCKDS